MIPSVIKDQASQKKIRKKLRLEKFLCEEKQVIFIKQNLLLSKI